MTDQDGLSNINNADDSANATPPTPPAPSPDDVENTFDNAQEREDALAAQNAPGDALPVEIPASHEVEGQPSPQETEVPSDAGADTSAGPQADTAEPPVDNDAPATTNSYPPLDVAAEAVADDGAGAGASDTVGDDGAGAGASDEGAGAAEAVDESGTPVAAAPVTPAAPPLPYKRGDIIDGVITETSPTSVEFDLSQHGEGLRGTLPSRELDRLTKETIDELQVGATVKVFVVNPRDPRTGVATLSVNRAQEELDWSEAERYRKDRRVYDGVVSGYNKGGLIVRFGRLRGFVPQSQIGETRRADGATPDEQYSKMVKDNIAVKVIEVDRERNRLILSERAAAREYREGRKARLIEELTVGEVRRGRVVSLEDFGAFVDVGGAEGLVHVTELSWGHVTHPRQVLKVGEEIEVKVISVDRDNKRIGLSLKSQLPDPWDDIASGYSVGQLVRAEVTKLTKFGAFAQLTDAPEVEGLIHISELSDERVAKPQDVVKVGDILTLRIIKVDVKQRRLGLSLKKVNSTEYLDQDMDRYYN